MKFKVKIDKDLTMTEKSIPPIGTKAEIEFINVAMHREKRIVTIFSSPFQNGFLDLKALWSYKKNAETDKPAFFIKYLHNICTGKRTDVEGRIIRIDKILSLKIIS